jgi:hypothetical protein
MAINEHENVRSNPLFLLIFINIIRSTECRVETGRTDLLFPNQNVSIYSIMTFLALYHRTIARRSQKTTYRYVRSKQKRRKDERKKRKRKKREKEQNKERRGDEERVEGWRSNKRRRKQ